VSHGLVIGVVAGGGVVAEFALVAAVLRSRRRRGRTRGDVLAQAGDSR
jgi:hypothetical protein